MAALCRGQFLRLAADLGHRGRGWRGLRLLLAALNPGHFGQRRAVGRCRARQIAMRVNMGGKGINGGEAVDQLAQGDGHAKTFGQFARGLRQQQ